MFGAILCVNRADRLKITIWFAGECHPEEQIAPLFLEAFDPTIEDFADWSSKNRRS